MFSTLSPGAIGVKAANLDAAIDKAKRHGFGGTEFNVAEVADLVDREGAPKVRARFIGAGVHPGGWGLPTNWRADEAAWKADLEKLPRLAKAAAAIGGTRTFTWVLSWSDTLPRDANRKFHVERFTPVARILADAGCSLGLEFLGPRTLWQGKAHEFIHDMGGMLEIGKAIGPNVGLLLDCWHWHASGGTVEAIRKLRPADIAYVHVNDAPKGVALEALIDNTRCLPGETGVIDIKGFLGALQQIGYDGPVTPEPFKKELNALPSDDARLDAVARSMQAIFKTAGLTR